MKYELALLLLTTISADRIIPINCESYQNPNLNAANDGLDWNGWPNNNNVSEVQALYDHLNNIVLYKDMSVPACFAEENQATSTPVSLKLLTVSSSSRVEAGKLNSTFVDEFCGQLPIFLVKSSETNNTVTSHGRVHRSRRNVRRGEVLNLREESHFSSKKGNCTGVGVRAPSIQAIDARDFITQGLQITQAKQEGGCDKSGNSQTQSGHRAGFSTTSYGDGSSSHSQVAGYTRSGPETHTITREYSQTSEYDQDPSESYESSHSQRRSQNYQRGHSEDRSRATIQTEGNRHIGQTTNVENTQRVIPGEGHESWRSSSQYSRTTNQQIIAPDAISEESEMFGGGRVEDVSQEYMSEGRGQRFSSSDMQRSERVQSQGQGQTRQSETGTTRHLILTPPQASENTKQTIRFTMNGVAQNPVQTVEQNQGQSSQASSSRTSSHSSQRVHSQSGRQSQQSQAEMDEFARSEFSERNVLNRQRLDEAQRQSQIHHLARAEIIPGKTYSHAENRTEYGPHGPVHIEERFEQTVSKGGEGAGGQYGSSLGQGHYEETRRTHYRKQTEQSILGQGQGQGQTEYRVFRGQAGHGQGQLSQESSSTRTRSGSGSIRGQIENQDLGTEETRFRQVGQTGHSSASGHIETSQTRSQTEHLNSRSHAGHGPAGESRRIQYTRTYYVRKPNEIELTESNLRQGHLPTTTLAPGVIGAGAGAGWSVNVHHTQTQNLTQVVHNPTHDFEARERLRLEEIQRRRDEEIRRQNQSVRTRTEHAQSGDRESHYSQGQGQTQNQNSDSYTGYGYTRQHWTREEYERQYGANRNHATDSTHAQNTGETSTGTSTRQLGREEYDELYRQQVAAAAAASRGRDSSSTHAQGAGASRQTQNQWTREEHERHYAETRQNHPAEEIEDDEANEHIRRHLTRDEYERLYGQNQGREYTHAQSGHTQNRESIHSQTSQNQRSYTREQYDQQRREQEQRQTAEREAHARQVAERQALERQATERDAHARLLAEREALQRQAEEREAHARQLAEREALIRQTAEREAHARQAAEQEANERARQALERQTAERDAHARQLAEQQRQSQSSGGYTQRQWTREEYERQYARYDGGRHVDEDDTGTDAYNTRRGYTREEYERHYGQGSLADNEHAQNPSHTRQLTREEYDRHQGQGDRTHEQSAHVQSGGGSVRTEEGSYFSTRSQARGQGNLAHSYLRNLQHGGDFEPHESQQEVYEQRLRERYEQQQAAARVQYRPEQTMYPIDQISQDHIPPHLRENYDQPENEIPTQAPRPQSKCHLVTFTCTVVSKSNGRAKLCRPAGADQNAVVVQPSVGEGKTCCLCCC